MKIVKFLGGLGNQLFQYAFYRALEQQFGQVKADIRGFEHYVLHNGFELEKVFGVRLKHASPFEINLLDHRNRRWKYRKLRRLLFLKGKYQEEDPLFVYNPVLFEDPSSAIYWGYWQHHGYVDRVIDQLRKELVFLPVQSGPNLDLIGKLAEDQESVAIHVRRGDYLKDPYLGGLVDLAYFEKGISLMKGRLVNPKFYVFSDDILWCREMLGLPANAVFVDWNKGAESYRDMQLISLCKHAIISNSSFSWWGAWLNLNPDKIVIVPKVWYRSPSGIDTSEMHAADWIKL